ncbi:putative aldo-keto reductase [Ramicandelaber brevisporus]|nr:putative aldo-keto reductase [Ramicandelaber brevisporus]
MTRPFALSNGLSIPAVGFGTWRLRDPAACTEAVKTAIVSGYRHIDTAHVYMNEGAVGAGIAAGLAATGLPRESLWITSKLWGNQHNSVAAAVDRMLSELGVAYLDLLLVHFPIEHDYDYETEAESNIVKWTPAKVWPLMEALVDAGKVRCLGVSNFRPSHIDEVLDLARIRPLVNQCEKHPFFAQSYLVEECAKRGVHVTAYCPLGSTFEPAVLKSPVLAKIAQAHNTTPAVVALSWGVQTGTSVVPKSENADRIKENLNQVELSAAEVEEISAASPNVSFSDPVAEWGSHLAWMKTDP